MKMEEEKLQKRKKKAQHGNDKQLLADACNTLADYYYSQKRYDDALDEYKEVASIYKTSGLKLEWGTANRMIGEMYSLLDEYEKALKYEEKHLATAKELNNSVEEQRAMATIGRIHLLHGQNTIENKEKSTEALKAAEKAFLKSLVLCESLKGKISTHEFMDMRARLLLNIGVVLEHLDQLEKSIEFIEKAILICTNQDLYDLLYTCYKTEAQMLKNKFKDYTKALNCLNKALEVAVRLDDKVVELCDTLTIKADILCIMSDYQSAKQVLLKAWKLKTPDEFERERIESSLKIVASICYTEDLLVTTDHNDHRAFKRLYEKLGDGACALGNYTGAIDYYLKMLEHAELAGEEGKSLIPIYVSLYQTYKDLENYNMALKYCQMEYDLVKDDPKEAYATLSNIAEYLYLAKKPYETVEKACNEARDAAKLYGSTKYEIRILKHLLKYQEEFFELDKMDDTKAELKLLGCFDFDNFDNLDDDNSSAESSQNANTPNIGDDICLDDLTDLSDTNEEEVVTKTVTRKRGRGFAIKKNLKGETQLHSACISGNKLLVERLIANGHPINIRDNAGWLPLHEACIHGHLEIVNMLLNHGAHINDRGGSECEGVTPLYDAACNGHLEIVSLLLEKGALSLKTHFGQTPLDILQEWRAKNILTKDEEFLYNNVCNKLSNIDKSNARAEILNRSKSITPKKESPPSTSKGLVKSNLVSFRSRNVIEDDSDDGLKESPKKNDRISDTDDNSNSSLEDKYTKKRAGVNEYRNAMKAIRNRNITDDVEIEIQKKPKAALLPSEEVVDDWLDDDMGLNSNQSKKRKLCDDTLTMKTKKSTMERVRKTVDELNAITEPLRAEVIPKNRRKCLEIDSDNSSDVDLFKSIENINPNSSLNESKTTDSRKNMQKRWKQQSTLLKAGFQRKRPTSETNYDSSNSDCEVTTTCNTKAPSEKPNVRKSSRDRLSLSISSRSSSERVSSTYSPKKSIEALNPVQNYVNAIPNVITIPRSANLVQQIMPPAAVRVTVEDKTFLISLKLDKINKFTIAWLVEEVKLRYYKMTGVRPVFSLMTSDGAILSEDDPLSLVLSSPELKTSVTNWKASHAEERYLECCEALGIATSEEIQNSIGRSHTTHRLSLGAKTLSSTQIRPLFRAITHQSHITALILPDNNLGNDGMKYLADCISTLKNLTHLDLSNNDLSAESVKILTNAFEKASRPICQNLDHLNLSYNPIGDIGFHYLTDLTKFVNLKILKLNNCSITENVFKDKQPNICLKSIECLDLSNNLIKQSVLSSICLGINASLVTELELGNLDLQGSVVGFLGNFFDTAKELKLRKFKLTHCGLTDSQFMRIYRCFSKAKHLQHISLQNNSVTFITFKKLLQRQPPIPQIDLQGCNDIFKYAQDSDFQIWLPAIDFGICNPVINVTPISKSDEERESVKLFSKTWLSCFKGRGLIEHFDGGVRYTAS